MNAPKTVCERQKLKWKCGRNNLGRKKFLHFSTKKKEKEKNYFEQGVYPCCAKSIDVVRIFPLENINSNETNSKNGSN